MTLPQRLSVLFLQGHPSAFSRDLGAELARRGHRVTRVNVCAGDWLYWRGPETINYRGRADGWQAFLETLCRARGVTHIVYFADRLPWHVAAQRVADRLGINAVSYEFGYLRPDWIIVERGGQSAWSHFPDSLPVIRKLAKGLPAPDMTLRYRFDFGTEALNEVVFNLSNVFLWFLYPHYDTDRRYHPLREYLGYIPRLIRARRRAEPARQAIARLVDAGTPVFTVALQMQGDYQIRRNSPYRDIREFVQQVITSFAAHADPAACLVFKKHPLDNGLERWGDVVSRLATAAGIADRVIFLDGGDLQALLRASAGVIIINSTVGLHALQALTPVKTMGIALYDIPGLTHQGPLDRFWAEATPPAQADVTALVRLLAAALHVKGDFYSPKGRKAGVTAMADRLETDGVNGHGAFVPVPPRLEKAAAIGVRL
jgi:capsular polysaccharide export protein